MNIGKMDRRIRIEYPSLSQGDYGESIPAWLPLTTVWADVQDVPPSRSEAVRQGLKTARNQTRFRFRYMSNVTSAMRIVLLGTTDKIFEIVGGPAEIGRQRFTECVGEVYSS